MRIRAALVLALVLAACGEGPAPMPVAAPAAAPAAVPAAAPAAAPTTTTTAGPGVTVTVAVPVPPVAATVGGACGPYRHDPLTWPQELAPPTTMPSAPLDASLAARALRPGDIPCTEETTVEENDPYHAGPFSPCGFPFANTSTAFGQYRSVLQPAQGYVGGQLMGPPVLYLDEVVARFTPSGAVRVLADFRAKVEACPMTGGWPGKRGFDDQPYYVINGEVQPQPWSLSTVDVPIEADDVYAVEFYCCEPGRYLLVAMRRGPYVAFLRTFYPHGAQRGATPSSWRPPPDWRAVNPVMHLRRGLVIAVLTLTAACSGGSGPRPQAAAPPTTAGAPFVAPAGVTPAGCGDYAGPSDVMIGFIVPPTTTPPAPDEPALAARALRPGDVGCTRESTVEALDPYRATQFSPCGFAFADTSRALGQHRIVLEPAIGYVGDQVRWPPVPYVEEVVARFTPSGAAQVFDDFRGKVEACPEGTDTNMRVFQDIPQFNPTGTVRTTSWDLAAVEVPVEADDVYAVEFFKADSDRYLLVAMRRGPYVAFVRTVYRRGEQRAATPFLLAAASRLAGG